MCAPSSAYLDTELVLACAVTPANRPEEAAAPQLQKDMARMGVEPDVLQLDRAYLHSSLVEQVVERGGKVVCKPWQGNNARPGLFGKKDFDINIRQGTITCPAGQVEPFEPGQVVEFDPEACGPCPLRAQCTQAASGRGRTVSRRSSRPTLKVVSSTQPVRCSREVTGFVKTRTQERSLPVRSG
jgi:hypothetical protein